MKVGLNDKTFKSVSDVYNLDEDELFCRAQGSDYWKNSNKFYSEVKTRSIDSITEGQKAWLNKIKAGLKDYYDEDDDLCYMDPQY